MFLIRVLKYDYVVLDVRDKFGCGAILKYASFHEGMIGRGSKWGLREL